MIASLTGKITYKSPQLRKDSYFVISCAGVGYKVYTPLSNLQNIIEDTEMTIFTYMSVSERALDLFGFTDPADKTFFTMLLDVPGIGPKKAIGILDKAKMSDVAQAIIEDDVSILTSMSGLAEKTAEKIMLALKDKVASLSSALKDGQEPIVQGSNREAFDALVGFGYSTTEANQALQQIDPKITDVGEKIKASLKLLGKNK